MKPFTLILAICTLSHTSGAQKFSLISDPLEVYIQQNGAILARESIREIFATINWTGDTLRRFKLNPGGQIVASGYGTYISGLELSDCENIYDCRCISSKSKDSIRCDGEIIIAKTFFGFWRHFEYDDAGRLQRIVSPANEYLGCAEQRLYYTTDGLLDSVVIAASRTNDISRMEVVRKYIFKYGSNRRLISMRDEQMIADENVLSASEFYLRYQGDLLVEVALETFDGDAPMTLSVSYSKSKWK